MNASVADPIDAGRLKELLQSEVPFFQNLKEADMGHLLPYFQGKNLCAGDALWQEGGSADYLAFVLSGKLQLKKETEFKGKQVVVGVLSAGALTGELCFFVKGSNALTVEALEDCRLALFSRADYRQLEESRPDLALILVKNMLVAVSLRLQKSYERLASIF